MALTICNTKGMNLHLQEISADPSPGFLDKPRQAIDEMIRELDQLPNRTLLPQPKAVQADQKRTK